MEHVQKMFLVPQHQLDLIKQQQQQQQTGSIRQQSQNELDKEMLHVLQDSDVDVYEKAKKYSDILQRYLTLVRQGAREKNVLSLSLPEQFNRDVQPQSADTSPVHGDAGVRDLVAENVLTHIPKRSRRNAELILSAVSRSPHLISYNDKGEIVVDKHTIPGSHIYDLIKGVTTTHTPSEGLRPIGWTEFLKAVSDLNVPLSAISNTGIRKTVAMYKTDHTLFEDPGFLKHTPKKITPGGPLRHSTLKKIKNKKNKLKGGPVEWLDF